MEQNLSRRLKFWLGIITGVVFLYLAVRNTQFDKTFAVIQGTLLGPIVVSVGLRTIALWIRGLRWKRILQQVKEVPAIRVFRIVCIGELGNYLLPARIGDVMRGMMIAKKESISKGFSLTSIVIDRLLDVLVVSFLFVSFSFALSFPKWVNEVSYMVGSAFIIIVVGWLVLLWGKDHINRFTQTIFSIVPKLKGIVGQLLMPFFEALGVITKSRLMIHVTVLSIVLWGIYSAAFYFVLMGLRIELAWYVPILAVSTVALGQIIPSAPGFVGTSEFLYVSILTLFSVEKSAALACALMARGLQYGVIVGTGSLCYFWEKISVDYRTSDRTQKMEAK